MQVDQRSLPGRRVGETTVVSGPAMKCQCQPQTYRDSLEVRLFYLPEALVEIDLRKDLGAVVVAPGAQHHRTSLGGRKAGEGEGGAGLEHAIGC